MDHSSPAQHHPCGYLKYILHPERKVTHNSIDYTQMLNSKIINLVFFIYIFLCEEILHPTPGVLFPLFLNLITQI